MRTPRAVARDVARMARELSGRATAELLALLREQLEWTERGARIVAALTEGLLPVEDAHRAMSDVEHRGDEARARLVGSLDRVLTTPIGAEDMFRFSRSVDDVLDNLRDFVREVDLYRPEQLDFAVPLAKTLVVGVERLVSALQHLDGPPGRSRHATLATRKAAGQVRRLYQQELGELLNRSFGNETLKRRELLRRLDVVGLRLGEAADALADGALKRSR